jgi:hypothetical protein
MRQGLGKGTPRGWQGFSTDALLTLLQLWMVVLADTTQESASQTAARALCTESSSRSPQNEQITSATDC